MHLPLKCRCHQSLFTIHPTKIVCENKFCNFTENFELHETLVDVFQRMKSQGCYYLEKDKDKLKNELRIDNKMQIYR